MSKKKNKDPKPKEYKERRLYIFRCSGCDKPKRQSFRRSRAGNKLCRKCRINRVNPNQLPLIPEPTPTV